MLQDDMNSMQMIFEIIANKSQTPRTMKKISAKKDMNQIAEVINFYLKTNQINSKHAHKNEEFKETGLR